MFSPFYPVVLHFAPSLIYNRRDGKNFIGSLIESVHEVKLSICPICFIEIYDNSGLKHKYEEGYKGPK